MQNPPSLLSERLCQRDAQGRRTNTIRNTHLPESYCTDTGSAIKREIMMDYLSEIFRSIVILFTILAGASFGLIWMDILLLVLIDNLPEIGSSESNLTRY
jgi:hypothetical protein